MHEGGISIWFFIGICLLVMGGLIFGSGIFQLISPPPAEHRVVLYDLHAPIWWGALLFFLGVFYAVQFRPSRTEKSRSAKMS
jgi:hypothetical protein